MNREWYLIDEEGIHPIMQSDEPEDFWKRFDRSPDEALWPAFNQVVLRSSTEEVLDALHETGRPLGVALEEVTEQPERWLDALVVARSGELAVLGEPGVDLDDRVMALPWTENLVEYLRCDGVFFGYDPQAATLHLTEFREGMLRFAWSDSVLPGPSYAMVFDEDGACTREDPRRFALRLMEMPETSPLLDRFRFVTERLEQIGLSTISPELEDLPVEVVFALTLEITREEPGG